jgi:hypothetical protein
MIKPKIGYKYIDRRHGHANNYFIITAIYQKRHIDSFLTYIGELHFGDLSIPAEEGYVDLMENYYLDPVNKAEAIFDQQLEELLK